MKNNRQKRILEIIRSQNVGTQEELLLRLCESGYSVTQATVSRDINSLRLVKVPDGSGGYKYAETGVKDPAGRSRFLAMFTENVTSVARGQNVVCVKCLTGMAQAVCASLDSVGREPIVGTLAGEDTIFVLCKNEKDAEALAEEMQKMLLRA
ncbi:MAG: arginine repressor [Clostridia bacterium]|nr:arginine repressor [Clostridia bacterium]